MPRNRADEDLPHFCTITVLDWLPIFIESRHIDPIIDSLSHCRQHKGLQLFGFVVMPNHMHLIGAAANLHPLMRDFKRFTSRSIHDRLKEDGRTTLLDWLGAATEPARRQRGELGFWQAGFHPKAIWSVEVFEQKLRYLQENPVRKGLVQHPENWWYSSAGHYADLNPVCAEMDVLDL